MAKKSMGLALATAVTAVTAVAAQEIVAPSGVAMSLYDVVLEPDTGMARLRFLAPAIAGTGFDAVSGDFGWLCETYAAPALAANGWAPRQVVISLSDRLVEFGAMDPDATQFFEAFRIDGQSCIWEAF